MRVCARAWTCLTTNSSSCSRAESATRRIRKRSCAQSPSPVARGLDAVLLNLGGGHREFLALAGSPRHRRRVRHGCLRGAAVHPMKDLADYFRAADAVALASLAEGAAYSTLEALACETPVVATAVGGMAVQLRGHASLTPRRDAHAMADALLAIAAQSGRGASTSACLGREYVCREWNRDKAFGDLAVVLQAVANQHENCDESRWRLTLIASTSFRSCTSVSGWESFEH